MQMPIKIPKFFRNKYSITAIVFVFWIAFFDQNNLITQIQYRMELDKLEEERKFYQEEIESTQSDLDDLQRNPKSLEKFAREKYLMKKDNEEIFVIVEEED